MQLDTLSSTKAAIYQRKWRLAHPSYQREYCARNREKIQEKNRNWQFKKRYGFSRPKNPGILQCQICGNARKILIPDHIHNTIIVRGWLCRSCNYYLGWFERCKKEIENYLAPFERCEKEIENCLAP